MKVKDIYRRSKVSYKGSNAYLNYFEPFALLGGAAAVVFLRR